MTACLGNTKGLNCSPFAFSRQEIVSARQQSTLEDLLSHPTCMIKLFTAGVVPTPVSQQVFYPALETSWHQRVQAIIVRTRFFTGNRSTSRQALGEEGNGWRSRAKIWRGYTTEAKAPCSKFAVHQAEPWVPAPVLRGRRGSPWRSVLRSGVAQRRCADVQMCTCARHFFSTIQLN